MSNCATLAVPLALETAALPTLLSEHTPLAQLLDANSKTNTAESCERLLRFLSLNAHLSSADIADLRLLLTRYPAQAVYNAVQRACQEHLREQRAAGLQIETQEHLSMVLLSPLFHLASVSHFSVLAA
jgi:hypothetical protein